MAAFVIRVELHSAKSGDYDSLHGAMEQEGFARTIKAGDGTIYDLPNAEYVYQGNKTQADVYALADTAAARTQRTFWLLVTESNGSTFKLKRHQS